MNGDIGKEVLTGEISNKSKLPELGILSDSSLDHSNLGKSQIDIFKEIERRANSQYTQIMNMSAMKDECGLNKTVDGIDYSNIEETEKVTAKEIICSPLLYNYVVKYGVSSQTSKEELEDRLNQDVENLTTDKEELLCLVKALIQTKYNMQTMSSKLERSIIDDADIIVSLKNGVTSEDYILYDVSSTGRIYIWDKENMLLRSYSQEKCEEATQFVRAYNKLNE